MTELAKPMQFYYVPPDIMNFPTQNKELAKDFNFLAEMFKFMPKVVTVAMEGKRLAENDNKEAIKLGGWKISNEWYDALEEYTVPQNLYDTLNNDPNYHIPTGAAMAWSNVQEVENTKNWNYDYNMVSGFVHFNNGTDKNEYFWGEKTAAALRNVQYDAKGCQWNHLEKKLPLGLASLGVKDGEELALDDTLNADVDKPYFIGDFLASIGSNWGELQGILNKLSGQSYYQMVMNAVEPGREGSSYAALSNRENTILIASMVESRNRVYKIASDVFGPVALTWNDREMMANFENWASKNYEQGLSHGVNAFRLILETSHLMLNQIYQFSRTSIPVSNDNSYTMSILDRYAFRQYAQASGAEYFNNYSSYSGFDSNNDGKSPRSDRKGAIFGFIDEMMPGCLGSVRDYLCEPLSSEYQLSYDTRVDQMPDPPAGTSNPGFIKAMKWLIEQWFGASTWVRPNYNNMPKSVALAPRVDYASNCASGSQDDKTPTGYDVNGRYVEKYKLENIGGRQAYVPQAVYDPNSSRSMGWDRVAGPWDWDYTWSCNMEDTFWGYQSGHQEWYDVYMGMRAEYGSIGWLNPNIPAQDAAANTFGYHNTYARKQFGGLNQQEILGRGGYVAPFNNSWAVHIEGRLQMLGDKTDKIRMNIFTFMDQSGSRRYKRAQERYTENKEEQKYDEAQEEKQMQKISANHKAEQRRAETQIEALAQKHQKEERTAANKSHKKGRKRA